MKTWISYLAATAFGLAATLLFGESALFSQIMYTITALFVQLGGFVLIPLVFIGFASGIASLRKDSKGGVFARTTILWSILTTLLLTLAAGVVFRFFPALFPASSSAGSDPRSLSIITPQSLSQIFSATLPVNPFYSLVNAESFLFPIIIISLIFGYFLKPNLEVIRPAYVTMNSLSETMMRLAKAYSSVGFFFIFFASSYWFTHMQYEGTLFVAGRFLLMLLAATLGVLLILLPLLFGIASRFRLNPYKVIYRMLAPAIAALFSGSIFFSSPMTISLSRHNLGVQKRVGTTAVPLYTIIGRGGSAMIATLSVLSLLYAAAGQMPSDKVLLIVALSSAMFSYLSPLYLGWEVFFITTITLQFLNLDLHGAELSVIGLMPLLNGLGILLDSYIAAFGAAYTTQRMGVKIDSSYRDTI